MHQTLKTFLILTFALQIFPARAQFHTITKDTAQIQLPENFHEADYNYVSEELKSETATHQDTIDYFGEPKGKEITIERSVPVFVNPTDSLLMGLLRNRLNVCLPLDYLQYTSSYGFRVDPIQKCRRFHDGIDLRCRHAYVYSMLPGIVRKVTYSNKGYGNHVILDYGNNIQCLYGHLSMIAVAEGEAVMAGTIVGVSGSTGKSTGEHLHILLRKDGKSVDPAPFIAYLNKYITGLQDKIAYTQFGVRPPMDLNIANLYTALDKYHISNPSIVVAQALLETGYFTSYVCKEKNNLFGLRRPSDGSYYSFRNWEESVKAYKDYVQYKYKGGDYYTFLRKIGYAEDPFYVDKLRSIARSLSLSL